MIFDLQEREKTQFILFIAEDSQQNVRLWGGSLATWTTSSKISQSVDQTLDTMGLFHYNYTVVVRSCFLCPRDEESGGILIYPCPFVRLSVRIQIHGLFSYLLLQFWSYSFNILQDVYTHNGGVDIHRILIFIKYLIMTGSWSSCPSYGQAGASFVSYRQMHFIFKKSLITKQLCP